MKKIYLLFAFLNGLFLQSQNTTTIIFSAIKGTQSKVQIINIDSASDKTSFEISGSEASYFSMVSPKNRIPQVELLFTPADSFIGLAKANLIVKDKKGDVIESIQLKGLSTKALEGKNEPSLDQVVKALGYEINLGWTALANHTRPELQGDELPITLFKKAGEGKVEMTPVARYSPAFTLPYGYYTVSNGEPELNQVGVLAGSENHYEHQTLFPSVIEGEFSFNPKDASFGFYTTSPSHVAYSEDTWNEKLNPKQAGHAVRVYAVNDSEGKSLRNTFLVCFEEAKNGDYQDYVFLVKNIKPNP